METYAVIHFVAAAVSLSAAYFTWKRRSAPGAKWLFLLMIAAAQWTFCDGMDLSVTQLETHLMWAKASYLGAGAVPVFLLLFTLEYTQQEQRLSTKGVAMLFTVPLFGLFAALSNEQHQLVWTGFLQASGNPRVIVYQHGPIFWFLALYSFALLFVSAIVIVSFALKTGRLYRGQNISIIVAILLPWSAAVVYVHAPGLVPGFYPSIALVVSGSIMTLSILKHRLFDLVPIAREALQEKVPDGLLALDSAGQVVDLNPATIRLLELQSAKPIGQPISRLLESWPEAAAHLLVIDNEDYEFTLCSRSGSYIGFEVSVLLDNRGVYCGNLVVVRDVTDRVRNEQALKQANDELQSRVQDIESLHMKLSEQAIRDPLTGLFNRRYLSETLPREIGRAAREGYPVSFIMLDVDAFKQINDVHGHATGDHILRFLGSQLASQTRAGDIACRYGGDEFLVVLTNTALETAIERAERWRTSFQESSTSVMGLSEVATLSAGVAAFPIHGETAEQVFAAADGAMYAAKAAGRNRVTVSPCDRLSQISASL